MKVLLLSRYGRLGASSRVRVYQYLPYLQSHGISVTVAPLLTDEYLRNLYSGKGRHVRAILAAYTRRLKDLRTAALYDLVWIEKEAFPWLPPFVERSLSRRQIPYVVDYDDAIFHNYDRNRMWFIRRILGQKIDEVMSRSELVIVGNDYLAERAHRAGAKRVEMLPTVIDLDHYCVVPKTPSKPFKIGWIGTPVTAPYLQVIRDAIAELCQSDSARLVMVGSGDITLAGVPQEVRPWSEQTEAADIQSFDAGIMPLPDADWERGKCGYKLIQYMACGLPVVASPVGVNKQIVEEGKNGFLATTQQEWLQALTTLRDDPTLCKQMGAASRARIEQDYCLQVTAPRLYTLLLSAANGQRCS